MDSSINKAIADGLRARDEAVKKWVLEKLPEKIRRAAQLGEGFVSVSAMDIRQGGMEAQSLTDAVRALGLTVKDGLIDGIFIVFDLPPARDAAVASVLQIRVKDAIARIASHLKAGGRALGGDSFVTHYGTDFIVNNCYSCGTAEDAVWMFLQRVDGDVDVTLDNPEL